MLSLKEGFNKGYSVKKDIMLIGALLCFAIFCFLINYFFVKRISSYDRKYIEYTNQLTVLSQSVSKDANEAMDGSLQAFRQLLKHKNSFSEILDKLKQGEESLGTMIMPPSISDIMNKELRELEETWTEMTSDIQSISFIETSIIKLSNSLNSVSKEKVNIDRLEEITANLQLGIQAYVKSLVINYYKILYDMHELLDGSRNARTNASEMQSSYAQFYSNAKKIEESLKNYKEKDENIELSLSLLREMTISLNSLAQNIEEIVNSSSSISNLEFASNRIYSNSTDLLDKANILKAAYKRNSDNRLIGDVSTSALIILSLLLLILLGYRTHVNSRNSYLEVELEKSENEKAIQLLVNELIDLANGNLTVNATVTEGILGAIAESINYAINALRKLIFIVNQTTEKVSIATKETKDTTKKLAEASSHQASEIVAVTASVNAMASSIEHVSKTADKSKVVAESSLDTASSGKQIVQATISGMEKIRQQIQETSKKIKRLGESSQEIGEMVLLIDDIAEQTNILSLNAAIQAAMAGEAGKGFGVVADEVQRLAERSGDATKQISALVKTIQADTNQAVSSMENTTTEVVNGAKFAEDAGVALNKIENVSNELAMLVKDIAKESMQQAETSSIISKTMDVIQSIATDTASGTASTAGSTGMLAELVTELRNAVAGFLLPKDMRVEK